MYAELALIVEGIAAVGRDNLGLFRRRLSGAIFDRLAGAEASAQAAVARVGCEVGALRSLAEFASPGRGKVGQIDRLAQLGHYPAEPGIAQP